MILLNSPLGSTAHALAMTIRAAKENGEHEISIPCDTYHVYEREAATTVVCVANHGHNGYKSAAVVVEDAENLTIDGNGSTFILHGCMDFAIINRSKNITVRNLTVTCADTCNFQGKVLTAENGTVTVELENPPKIQQHGNHLFQKFFDNNWEPMGRTLDYVTETRELRPGSGDDNFGVTLYKLPKKLDGNLLHIYEVPVMPPVGDTVVFTMSRRCNQAFLTADSENVLFENLTVHTCWGMAFISQKVENITIRGCVVEPDEGRYWSAGQDATHFVNCRGKVVIENSRFENQLDDAVNLHGIYTLIEQVMEDKILVRYAHFQTRGIDIYSVGDRIQILDRESQQPLGFAAVSEVEVLNPDLTLLTLDHAEGQMEKGMIVENLSDEVDAVIRNNIVRNNRARGMLIAAKGKVEITDNHFHTSSSAIQFESDPIKWFECGGVHNVLIADNFFDDCRHGRPGKAAVIDISKRRKEVEGFYYHDTIAVKNNRFTQTSAPCVYSDNVKNLVFENNETVCETPVIATHSIVNGEVIH